MEPKTKRKQKSQPHGGRKKAFGLSKRPRLKKRRLLWSGATTTSVSCFLSVGVGVFLHGVVEVIGWLAMPCFSTLDSLSCLFLLFRREVLELSLSDVLTLGNSSSTKSDVG